MRTCVVLPTYNEAGTIAEIVERVLASTPEVDALVVDDNSPDGTGAIAEGLAAANPRVHVLHRARKEGLGPAYKAGFAWALARDYEAAMSMDSDFSHDPADVARFVEAAARADVVIGSRYMPGGDTVNWSRAREMLSRGAGIYARALLRFRLTDPTGGFRLYRRAVLEEVPFDEIHTQGYGFQLEMGWRAWLLGFRIVDIPIVFSERREGASKMSRAIILEAARAVARWSLRRRRPTGEAHPRSVARST